MTTQAEIGVTQPPAKAADSHQREEELRNRLPWGPRRGPALPTPRLQPREAEFRPLVSRTMRE